VEAQRVITVSSRTRLPWLEREVRARVARAGKAWAHAHPGGGYRQLERLAKRLARDPDLWADLWGQDGRAIDDDGNPGSAAGGLLFVSAEPLPES
jgi:hypothetical protein